MVHGPHGGLSTPQVGLVPLHPPCPTRPQQEDDFPRGLIPAHGGADPLGAGPGQDWARLTLRPPRTVVSAVLPPPAALLFTAWERSPERGRACPRCPPSSRRPGQGRLPQGARHKALLRRAAWGFLLCGGSLGLLWGSPTVLRSLIVFEQGRWSLHRPQPVPTPGHLLLGGQQAFSFHWKAVVPS